MREPSPPLFVHGKPIERQHLSTWIEDALHTMGREIATFVAQVWQSGEHGSIAADLALVLLVGGGAYYFSQEMTARIPHLCVPTRPEVGNALGYRALAEQMRVQREGVR